MWLPKDERKLLRSYWLLIGEVNKEKLYDVRELVPILTKRKGWKSVQEYGKEVTSTTETAESKGDLSGKKTMQRINAMFDDPARIDRTNDCLHERKLITLSTHCNDPDVRLISLTMFGFDLGRRYCNWWDLSYAWFEAYRNHWIWLILSFIGGILGSLLIKLFLP